MKTNHIRMIFGITAMLLWLVAFVPKVVFGQDGDRLVWQLDNWALLVAPIITLVYVILLILMLSTGIINN